jgi:hypothetical protein
VRSQQHDEHERRQTAPSDVFGPVTGFEAYLFGLRGHDEMLAPPAGGKTAAGANVYRLSPDGRRLQLVRQP